ncbi:MAG: cytochrome-c peroxidase [Desulfobaccales bacterium]
MKIWRKLKIREVSGLLAIALSLTLLAGTGWAQSLRTAIVPQPFFLGNYVVDVAAAVRLGKALFWDMQVGSDGVQACATCHFHAGADNRTRNQLNPDTLGGSSVFSPPDRPNSVLAQASFPFFKPVDPDTDTPLARPFNHDVVSSQGVKLAQFVDIQLGSAVDLSTPLSDPIFNLNRGGSRNNVLRGNRLQAVNTRRVEPRNTPTVINAAFNFANFWDGRANNIFNGGSPFGPADASARIFSNNGTATGSLLSTTVRLENSSLASQAVGPPTSDFEMSFRGRTWPKIGKKMLSLPPLNQQAVHPHDSVLGTLANSTDIGGVITFNNGLNTTYAALIQAAFRPQYWSNTNQHLEVFNPADPSLGLRIIPGPATPGNTNQFTQMEANFSFFFGLAVQLYEQTLVSGETPYDASLEAAGSLTIQQANGLKVFQAVGCAGCHSIAPCTTSAAETLVNAGALAFFPPLFLPPLAAIELMPTADRLLAFYDIGWNNTSVVPTANDPGRFATAPFINGFTGAQYPLDYSRLSMLKRDGKIQPGTYLGPLNADPIPPMPIGATQPPNRIGNHGAFKVPQLRNVELTGPFMHNGGMSTLRQVVDFYTRGGNFDNNNLADLDPLIVPLGQLLGEPLFKDDLVSFLLALTDHRVKNELAPFDHPELIVPHGADANGADITFRVPPVGAGGLPAEGLPPLQPFLNVDHFTP